MMNLEQSTGLRPYPLNFTNCQSTIESYRKFNPLFGDVIKAYEFEDYEDAVLEEYLRGCNWEQLRSRRK